jgi:hypothetical protein
LRFFLASYFSSLISAIDISFLPCSRDPL